MRIKIVFYAIFYKAIRAFPPVTALPCTFAPLVAKAYFGSMSTNCLPAARKTRQMEDVSCPCHGACLPYVYLCNQTAINMS